MTNVPWWRHAVCYQIYVRSFADSDGDGVGDLAGIAQRLPYLADLGVDAIWLTPFYRSPQADHGYDVADYRDVDPLFGSLATFDEMLAQAHELGLRVIVDIVPNHSSDQHEWFRAALAAGPGSPERERYVFRDGRGADGGKPPNNWQSVFGGPAWTQVDDGQWYLHLFDSGQPDFDWDNPEVGDEFESILRFWLDRGVDGFRIDVAHGLAKESGLPDVDEFVLAAADDLTPSGLSARALAARPYWDQPAVHDVYRRWHRVLGSYEGDRMAIAEAWVPTAETLARYIRRDELQQAFNFLWLQAEWSAAQFRQVIVDTFAAVEPVGASPTWVLANHDVIRTVTRYGDGPVGVARARSAALAMLALPGSAYVYQGDELGLPQIDVAEADRQDPTWRRGGGVGRDGCRIPIPWAADDAPPFGFGPNGSAPWLPQPSDWGARSVASQERDPESMLALYRSALRLRRELVPGLGDRVTLVERGAADVFAFARAATRPGESGLVCVVNCGAAAVPVGDLGEPILTSGPGVVSDSALAPDAAGWFRA
ncbi:MAG TPA: glycoside hydrolase family 13 protein [Nocardioidaceae bacterium]|nr:glycoside hydrolase family 13 protein [Nocardioidaceae bacterium]